MKNRDPRLSQTMPVPGTKNNDGAPLDDLETYTGYAFKKYTLYDEDTSVTPTGYPTTSRLNVILLGYADILLMYAEAQNEASGLDESVYDAVNTVRSRPSVEMPNIPPGISQDFGEPFIYIRQQIDEQDISLFHVGEHS